MLSSIPSLATLKAVSRKMGKSALDVVPWFEKEPETGVASATDEDLLEGLVDPEAMSRDQLFVNLQVRGLRTGGLKTALKERLKLYVQSQRESALAYMASDDAVQRQDVNLEESGSVYTCGANHQGQLGLGDAMPRETFTCVPKLKGKSVDYISVGADYCVAVTEEGEVYSWGGGGYAPLGHAKPKLPDDDDEMEVYLASLRDIHAEGEAHQAPKMIERLRGEGIVEVSAGYGHVVAVSDAGDVWTWGTGLQGQLGHGDLENKTIPTIVSTLQEKVIIAVSVGHSHSVCISDEDIPYTWGSLHGGRLGLGITEREDPNPRLRKYFLGPTLIPYFRGKKVLQVACSANHCLALVKDMNQVYSWGGGDGGRLGHGDAADKFMPTPVDAFRGMCVLQVACGPWHSAAIVMWPPLIDCGVVYTWGSGVYGQLGQGRAQISHKPGVVTSLYDRNISIKYISCGTHHNAVLAFDNAMYSWGSNKYGCLGADIEDEFTPVPQRVWAFDVMIAGVGRGSPRSIACGHDFTAVACFPYVGPSEDELIEMEAEKLHDVQKVAIVEAEKEIKRQMESEQKKDEARKRAGFHLLESKPLCDLCQVCSGFEPNIFKPSVCKECSHLKVRHTRQRVAADDDEEEGEEEAAGGAGAGDDDDK